MRAQPGPILLRTAVGALTQHAHPSVLIQPSSWSVIVRVYDARITWGAGKLAEAVATVQMGGVDSEHEWLR